MTPQALEHLMAELNAEDPTALDDLATDPQGLRLLMAQHFCELDAALQARGMPLTARHELMTAIAAHTMVENMVLHLKRLRHESDLREAETNPSLETFRAWMKRHRLG